MNPALWELIKSAGFGFAGDQLMKRSGLGERAESILDKIIPPAAAADASAIPQAPNYPEGVTNVPSLPEDKLIPADTVMTPEQEQMVMNRIATEAPERPRLSGRNYLPDIVMQEPAQPPMVDTERQKELDALINKENTMDFVRQYGSPIMKNAQRMLANEVPREVAQDPEMQKGAVATSSTQALAASGDAINEPGFFDKAGDFFSNLFGDEERMTRLALAFNSMRFEPDQGLATVLGKRLETLSAQRDRQKMAMSGNQTMKLLDKYPDLKTAYLSGQMTLKDVLTNINAMRRLEIDEGKPAAFRALEARAEAAGLKPGTDAYNQFMINGGQRKGMSIRVGKDGSIELVEGGDLSSLTEAQSNALTFSQRMKASNMILNQTEKAGTGLYNRIVNNIPLAGNYLITDEYQSYDQAKRDFINATLRKESGAAIAQSEFDNADRQYFPTPGDSEQVIAQKRANRELAQQLIEANVPNVNKIVEKSGADIGAGARTLGSQPTTQKPPITPEQARAELARRRGQ